MTTIDATVGMPTREGVVGAKCEEEPQTEPGHWRCLDHDEDFAHNFAMEHHVSKGEHTLAWVCHKHGPEVP